MAPPITAVPSKRWTRRFQASSRPVSHPCRKRRQLHGTPDASSRPAAVLSTRRLITALFFMAFGYGLLSLCLFRILSFSAANTAFFVLYIGAGMPIGACLAQRFRRDNVATLGLSIRAL